MTVHVWNSEALHAVQYVSVRPSYPVAICILPCRAFQCDCILLAGLVRHVVQCCANEMGKHLQSSAVVVLAAQVICHPMKVQA